jgi:hypothetical protein
MFRSEIKKLCVKLIPELYDLRPSSRLSEKDAIEWVQQKVRDLIKGAKFLRGPPDDEVTQFFVDCCFFF